MPSEKDIAKTIAHYYNKYKEIVTDINPSGDVKSILSMLGYRIGYLSGLAHTGGFNTITSEIEWDNIKAAIYLILNDKKVSSGEIINKSNGYPSDKFITNKYNSMIVAQYTSIYLTYELMVTDSRVIKLANGNYELLTELCPAEDYYQMEPEHKYVLRYQEVIDDSTLLEYDPDFSVDKIIEKKKQDLSYENIKDDPNIFVYKSLFNLPKEATEYQNKLAYNVLANIEESLANGINLFLIKALYGIKNTSYISEESLQSMLTDNFPDAYLNDVAVICTTLPIAVKELNISSEILGHKDYDYTAANYNYIVLPLSIIKRFKRLIDLNESFTKTAETNKTNTITDKSIW